MSSFVVVVYGKKYTGYVKHTWNISERETYIKGFAAGIKEVLK